MSKQRSGLLSGLVVGLMAVLICASGLGAAVHFVDRLPSSWRTFGDGVPLLAALAFVVGVLVGGAVRLVRPRSVLLSLFTALYAAAAVPAAMIGATAYVLATAGAQRFGSDAPVPGLTPQGLLDALPFAARTVWAAVSASWHLPAVMAAAALPAFALVLARALRLRRTGRHAAVEQPRREEETAPEPEPEYRAPFEPLQPPKQDPTSTGSFFLPPDRGQA
ncbi:hypothetical protein OUY22_30730 [Nonomuraea sp. MCN248]|uniref:Uncharacterized protein n=1 Tax=Nonomuraea corallina TaxID=2989783 RepID=A0ABT4SKT7_9ACTN|nr:hypothetical protein [Nonomuraea corallina]MDA0637807.1 hypothetical protein [Nonomuraea corallina]